VTDLQVVYAQRSPTQVTEGFYTVTDGLLVMRYEDGSPVDPERYRYQLKDGDDARQIATRFIKQIRKIKLGGQIDGFNDPIEYAPMGIA
jgi:hypothetical protein